MMHDHQAHGHHRHDGVDCDAALSQLFDFLDGELDDSLESRLRSHVERCKPCFERADFEKRFLEAVHAARVTETCPKALRERVLATLRAEGLGA
ncbi:MAG: zf-HC2 domain-containing protein [Gemmatimonadaceae bacterium]|nr:zf-HC2 domain-containing protein [Gemmatimonadaceae bacterium]